MLKGFKEFILRGNVVELATAVIIGAAFTAIVVAFTDNIINPLLNAIPTGSSDCAPAAEATEAGTMPDVVQMCPLGFKVVSDNAATMLDFGAVIAALINFLIVAAVVYFLIVVPYNKLSELAAAHKGVDADEAPATEVDVLTEIRDLLKAQSAAGPAANFATPNPAPGEYPPPAGPRR